MADSSFDPLGMVKAMGTQTDPFSWAQLYAQDAAKGQLHAEDMRNRLLIQEMVRAERAKEGQLDRENRSAIAAQHEAGALARLKLGIAAGRYGSVGRAGGGVDFEPGAMPQEMFFRKVRRGEIKAEDYRSYQGSGGRLIYYPKNMTPKFMNRGGTTAPASATPDTARPPARDPYADEIDDD